MTCTCRLNGGSRMHIHGVWGNFRLLAAKSDILVDIAQDHRPSCQRPWHRGLTRGASSSTVSSQTSAGSALQSWKSCKVRASYAVSLTIANAWPLIVNPFPLLPTIGIRATILIYVPPHDVHSVLDDAIAVLGADRGAALARELTKIHEEVVRGTLGTLRDRFDPEKEGGQTPRGEFVLVLAPPAESEGGGGHPAPSEQAIRRALRDAMAEGLRRSAAASHVAQVLGVPRRAVYRLSLEMDSNGSE